MRYPIYIYLLFFLITYSVPAQKSTTNIPDSLKNKSFDYLDDKIYALRKDSSKAAVYLYTYLVKAKKEENWKEIINGYQNLLYHGRPEQELTYADSMIFAGKKSGDNALIGSAYLTKGIVYYSQKKQAKALDHYLTANSYISKTKDDYLRYKVKYHIALIKFYIGYYEEAISLFRECIAHFKTTQASERPYLNSLHCLGISYNKNGDYGLCSQTNSIGIAECLRLNNIEMKAYFVHSEGINNYFKNNYGKAIREIEASLPQIDENNDFANIAIGNFYIGKSYWALHKREKALPYFLKVDKTFNEKEYLRADLREVYEILIKYYKGKNDLNKQLYYIDQLLKADALLYETNKYLIGKVHKEYDTPTLIYEKEQINEELQREKQYDIIFIAVISFLFTISLFLTYRHYKNKKIYQKRYDVLMQQIKDRDTITTKIKNDKSPIFGINSETVTEILKQLEKFENDKKFLEKDWNQSSLATYLKTNVKYLASILSHYRGKGFYNYINELRIDYIIALLYNETKYRKYTNSALAEESGFSTTQRFVFAFKAKTGISVNFFIEQINK